MILKTSHNLSNALDEVRSYAQSIVVADRRFRVNDEQLLHFSRKIVALNVLKSPLLFNNLPSVLQKLHFIIYFGVANFSYANPINGRCYMYNHMSSGKTLRRTNGFIHALLGLDVQWDSPDSILSLSDADWEEGLQLHNNDLYRGQERIVSIRKLAQFIKDGAVNAINSKEINSDALFVSLMQTGLFEDVFLKRIQVVLKNIKDLASRNNIVFLPDPSFSAMADYRLPQVFINSGVLVIDDVLLTKLERGVVIEEDEVDELLLRAYTVNICQRLSEILKISEADVDERVWHYSQKLIASKKMHIPAPRVATSRY